MSEKLPKGWKRVKLGEVVNITTGKLNSNAYQENGHYPFFTCAPKPLKINYYAYDLDAILLAGNNANGIFHIHRYKGKFNAYQRTYIITNKSDKIYLDYIYYSLRILVNYMKDISFGSATKFLTLTILENLEILLPPLPEQKAIASVLSSLDDKIDLLHRQNQTLEQMAETLFRKWFIEDAKDNWEEVNLKDIYIFEKGFEPGSKNYIEEQLPDTVRFIRVGDLLDDKGTTFIKKDIAKVICKKEDLLMSFDGTVGRINFGLEGAFSSGIRKIYSKNSVFDNLGLKYLIFKSKDIQDLINAHSSGTVILHASSSIDYLTFSFPKDEEYIREFNKLIDPIFNRILKNKEQIQTLENLRDILLPKLMSEEVRVKYD